MLVVVVVDVIVVALAVVFLGSCLPPHQERIIRPCEVENKAELGSAVFGDIPLKRPLNNKLDLHRDDPESGK